MALTIALWAARAVALLLLLALWRAIYNLYLHPAKAFPGPFLGRATRLYFSCYRILGLLERKTLQLHEEFGPVVRIAPDELSFNSGNAWDDIYGRRSKRTRLQKDAHFYMGAIAPNGETNMGAANDADHSRIRSVLAHGFSSRALEEQEALLVSHTNYLVQRLRETHGERTDAMRWMHHVTYDVVASLAFGETTRALKCDGWSSQARVVFEGIREGVSLVEVLRYMPFKRTVLNLLVAAFGKARRQNFDLSVAKAESRLTLGKDENVDFKNSAKELTASELTANIALLIDAGSETTASMLTGCLYYLTKNVRCLENLTKVIRDSFQNCEELSSWNLARVDYLSAVINESMRMFMPIPAALPRTTPHGGCTINDQFVPGGMCVGVPQYASYYDASNFQQPFEFIPERWTGDARFAGDRRSMLQPFSTGPRSCIGKNLAYAEIRLILARLLWNFDIELENECKAWHVGQKSWFIWDKPPLYLRFRPRPDCA